MIHNSFVLLTVQSLYLLIVSQPCLVFPMAIANLLTEFRLDKVKNTNSSYHLFAVRFFWFCFVFLLIWI